MKFPGAGVCRRSGRSMWLVAGVILAALVTSAAADEPAQTAMIQRLDDDLSAADRANIRIMELFTSGWFFTLGAVVGSFLNVVVYRLPAGIPLMRPRSRCPVCMTPILQSDNLPIIGWLRLKGRCRACGTAIPARYPLVELATGCLFLGLLHAELLSGGMNLPVRTPNSYRGVVWIIWYTKWDLIGIFAFHAWLLVTLLASSLIAGDGHRLPRRLLQPAIWIGLLGPVFWATLHPVPLRLPRPEWLSALRWSTTWNDRWISGWPVRVGIGLDGLLTALAGLLAGGLIGQLLSRRLPERRDLLAVTAVTGAFLGWQAAVTIGLLAAVLLAGTSLVRSREIRRWGNPVSLWSLATLIVVLTWRPLSDVPWLPGPESSVVATLLTLTGIGLTGSLTGRLLRNQTVEDTSVE